MNNLLENYRAFVERKQIPLAYQVAVALVCLVLVTVGVLVISGGLRFPYAQLPNPDESGNQVIFQVNPIAALHFESVAMSSQVDPVTLTTSNSTTRFTTGQQAFVAFRVNSDDGGILKAVWHVGGSVQPSPPLDVPKGEQAGAFHLQLDKSDIGGAYVELFWNGELAAEETFVITSN